MAAIDRTAYPRLGGSLTAEELGARYRLGEADLIFIRGRARGDCGRLTLATLLKCRQDLGYFPVLSDIHVDTIAHLSAQLSLAAASPLLDEIRQKTMLHRYRMAVRAYLDVSPYSEAAERLITATVIAAAETMSDPADLTNRAIEVLGKASIDLPAFSTLDRLVNHLRAQVHTRMYGQVSARLTPDIVAVLDGLLMISPGAATTAFNRLKQTRGAGPSRNDQALDRTSQLADRVG